MRIAGPYVHMPTTYPAIRLLASCTHAGTTQAQSSPHTKKKKIIIFFPHFQTSPGESLLKRLPRTLLFLLHCHNTEHKQVETLCNQIWYALFWCQCFLHPTSMVQIVPVSLAARLGGGVTHSYHPAISRGYQHGGRHQALCNTYLGHCQTRRPPGPTTSAWHIFCGR